MNKRPNVAGISLARLLGDPQVLKRMATVNAGDIEIHIGGGVRTIESILGANNNTFARTLTPYRPIQRRPAYTHPAFQVLPREPVIDVIQEEWGLQVVVDGCAAEPTVKVEEANLHLSTKGWSAEIDIERLNPTVTSRYKNGVFIVNLRYNL